MRKVLLVARREYGATIRTKGFIIGLLVAPLLMGGSLIVFAIFKDRVNTSDQTLAVLDRSGLVADVLDGAARQRNAAVVVDGDTGKKVKPAYRVEVIRPDDADPDGQRVALSDRVRRGEIHAFVEIGPGILHPRADPDAARIAFHAKNPAIDDMRKWIAGPINVELRKRRLVEASVDPASVPDLFHWINAEGLGLVTRDEKTGAVRPAQRRGAAEAVLVPLALPVLLFMMIMMGAQPRLSSVMEEKSQRIAEVILGSVDPFRFMAGKLIGGVAVAMTAASVYVIGGIIVIAQQDLGAYVPYHVLPWFFAYLVLSVVMFGALFTAVGSACNDPTEAQAIAFPAMLPVIFPLFVQMPVVTQPNGAFATGLSFVPPFTPMLMLIRQATPGGVPAWQPWVGLLGVLLCTVFLVWAGGRIFRVGILTQGTPPKLGNLIRWAIRG